MIEENLFKPNEGEHMKKMIIVIALMACQNLCAGPVENQQCRMQLLTTVVAARLAVLEEIFWTDEKFQAFNDDIVGQVGALDALSKNGMLCSGELKKLANNIIVSIPQVEVNEEKELRIGVYDKEKGKMIYKPLTSNKKKE